MKLSESDRKSLAQIAMALETEDPGFVSLMRGSGQERSTAHEGAAKPDNMDMAAATKGGRRALVFGVLLALVPVLVAFLIVAIITAEPVGIAVASACLTIDLAGAWRSRRYRKASRG